MMNQDNEILAPAEWLNKWHRGWESQEIGPEAVVELMNQYADYVAARVARNVRHRAVEVLNEEAADYIESEDQMGVIIGNRAGQRIMNIPLRAVYPEGQNKGK